MRLAGVTLQHTRPLQPQSQRHPLEGMAQHDGVLGVDEHHAAVLCTVPVDVVRQRGGLAGARFAHQRECAATGLEKVAVDLVPEEPSPV